MKNLFTILMFLTLLSFTVADDRSVYNIPLKAAAACATDYDLDGDLDIVVEHIMDSQTQWGGSYILKNDGYGHFSFYDSIFYSTGMRDVYADKVFSSSYPDIISGNGEYVNILSHTIEDYFQARFYMGTNIHSFDIGDINNDGYLDVVFISNLEKYWGVIYNMGDGSFTAPQYFDLVYSPNDIATGDLNNDERDDVVIAGIGCEIYFSTETGFEKQPLLENEFNVKIADLNNDGSNDILAFADAYVMSFVHLYKNMGNNTFDTLNNFNVLDGCSNFCLSDFNNDNLPDILFSVHYDQGGYLLYYNQGNFQFSEPQVININYNGEAMRNTCIADMDGNSYADIIITRLIFDTTVAPSLLEILFNDGQGNFVDNPLTDVQETPSTCLTDLLCYPNPFGHHISFDFNIQDNEHLAINIYSLSGQMVKVMSPDIEVHGTSKNLTLHWDGKNTNGLDCPPGIYIARLLSNGNTQQTKKIIKRE